ncbi:MAG: hypothetical protein WCY89_07960 [Flavobacteriaceae bacterium]
MKKRIITTIAFLTLSFTFAQQITVEEIYANYIKAIGGKDKLESIVNKIDINSLTSESTITGAFNSQTKMEQEIINFYDYSTPPQSATILKQPPSSLTGNKTEFTRYLTANGKTTMLFSDGKKQVMASTHNKYRENPFPDTMIPSGSKVLTNENFNGKEVYVVSYEEITGIIKLDCLAYFDIDSGLLLGTKSVSKQEVAGRNTTSTISLNMFEEYREVEGILIPHKHITNIKTETTGTVSMTSISNMITTVIAIEFNIDTEDFKQNCFQNPEACFEKYEKKIKSLFFGKSKIILQT